MAWMPHDSGSWDDVADSVYRAMDDFLSPITGRTLRGMEALPAELVGVELRGEGLAVLSIKEAESGPDSSSGGRTRGRLILRCVNTRSQAVRGVWSLGHPIRHAHLVRLDETRVEALEVVRGHEVSFQAGAYAVVSVMVY
jgi:hypothetical protein